MTFGNKAVERLFEYASWVLYGVYALFVVLAVLRFGGRISAAFAAAPPAHGWVLGGATYASYNLIGLAGAWKIDGIRCATGASFNAR